MNHHSIAAVTRNLSDFPSRRDVLRGLVGVGLGLAAARLPESAEAKKKRKGKSKSKKPKSKPNAYGCLNVGATCANDDQCCSGVCEGKTCRAHHTGICQVDYDLCTTGAAHVCNAVGTGDIACACVLTTGNAPFCGKSGDGITCHDCNQDADCEATSGPGAACIVLDVICEGLRPDTGNTACVAPCANPAK
jgi:hypothetical protein